MNTEEKEDFTFPQPLLILLKKKKKKEGKRMRLLFQKNDLISAIQIVGRAVASKTTMSIMECILIDATDGQITLTGNKTEFGIETICPGIIEEAGKVALEAKLFQEIVKRLPQTEENNLYIETVENGNCIISCEKSIFKIMGRNAEEFPSLPFVEKQEAVLVSQFSLRNMINQTIFSTANGENNKRMAGEYFEIKDNLFSITSLDGHRISIRKTFLKDSYTEQSAIVPKEVLSDLAKILTGDIEDMVEMYFSGQYLLFHYENTTVVTQLVEGEYFHVKQMLSTDYETSISVNRKQFMENIDRARILARDNDKNPLIFKITENYLFLKIISDLGRMDAEIPIKKEGNELMIAFNPNFLMDALQNIEEEEVSLYFTIPRSPVFIRDKEESYIYMILPVNFNADQVE